jgi:pimeloyl-ACP methyl ester carboxylesterase
MKKHLLLLHGAIGAKDQLMPLADNLRDSFEVHTPDFGGHGGAPFNEQPLSIALFASEVLKYMDAYQLTNASVFGYSMGGYVGMYLAKHYPERITKLATLATKYHWDEAIAAREIQMLNPEKIAQKLPAFAKSLQQRHAPNDWKVLLQKTAAMMVGLGADNTLKAADYASITTPALILLGDRDKMVSLEESVAVYKALPNAQMGMLPATQHPIEQADIAALEFAVRRFLN